MGSDPDRFIRTRDIIPPPVTLVLLAVLVLHKRFGRATIREAQLLAGIKSPSTAHLRLRQLREHGLVDWDDGHTATIRPTFEVIDGPWSVPLLESG